MHSPSCVCIISAALLTVQALAVLLLGSLPLALMFSR